MIGDENHCHFLSIDFDEHFHTTQFLRVLFFAFGGLEGDEVIAYHFAFWPTHEFFADVIGHVVLGSRDPEDSALGQSEEVCFFSL